LIRHARWPLMTAPPVISLAVAMVEPSFWTPLMTVVGAATLLASGLAAAAVAAIAVAAITGNANEKYRVALCVEAQSLPEYDFLGGRHALSQAGLDNGTRFVAGWNQLCLVLPVYGCRTPEPCRSNGRAPSRLC
jgi:hypothetical protein